MSDFISILEERGLLHQCSNIIDLKVLSRANAVKPYIGFDLTADSLHVGSLIQLMVLRWAIRSGVQPIVLLGTFTSRVGDPTGKNDTRPVMTAETLLQNQQGINAVIQQIINVHFVTRWNSDWLDCMSLSDFLFEYAPAFSVNRMLVMDAVKTRLAGQNHMGVLEFSYPMLQAIDFLSLHDGEGCNLQIGGSDQWSNMLMGVDLIRRKRDRNAFALTTPLMTNSAGEKMGKTVGGAVWLSKAKTPVQDFFQFWRNVEDAKVEEFLRLFTELSLSNISEIMSQDINAAKKRLASEVTQIVHGEAAAKKALREAEAMFEGGNEDDMPLGFISSDLFEKPLTHLVADIQQVSKSEARRLLMGGAIKINDTVVKIDLPICDFPLAANMPFMLHVGKRSHYRLVYKEQ